MLLTSDFHMPIGCCYVAITWIPYLSHELNVNLSGFPNNYYYNKKAKIEMINQITSQKLKSYTLSLPNNPQMHFRPFYLDYSLASPA